MKFCDFQIANLDAVVSAWNSWLPEDFHIDKRVLEQLTFHHPSWRNNTSKLVFEDEQLIGVLLARPFQKQTIIDALLVAPHKRRQGLGKTLLSHLGSAPLRTGGGPAHFLPGLPEPWKDAQRFFIRQGFQQDWMADDLHLKLSSRTAQFTSAKDSDREAVIEMIASEFSQRWTDDTAQRFDSGDTEDVLLIKQSGAPVAFCLSWHFQSQLLGPSTFWLRNSCPTFGGIGPVGVRAECRGQGLGKRIVEEALNYLHARKVTEVVVDWTAIGPFYEKSGFRPWKRYLGFHREAVS